MLISWPFTIITGTPVGIASDHISVVFLISNAIVKMFLKTMGTKKNKHKNIALLARSKLNSEEKISSKALIDSYISHNESLYSLIKTKTILV